MSIKLFYTKKLTSLAFEVLKFFAGLVLKVGFHLRK